jgi:hydrogenase/urease accessory protein HupE
MSAILDFFVNLTKAEIVIAAFVLVLGALLLPLSTGARQALVLLLIALCIFTLVGGGMDYVVRMFQ